MKIGFDPQKYLTEQSKYILERVNSYDKLYLEFGGKLIGDYHAKRVLPGFDPDAKIKLLHELRDKTEIIICVYSGDIERNKIRDDFGITYDVDVFRLIDDLRKYDLSVNSVVITRYENQPSVDIFKTKLERRGIKTYIHTATAGYPNDVDTIVSDNGYGKNPYIETTKPIVVVTAPGPGSGKLGTCLGQLYHEFKQGNSAGYSKFETFPVWNVPLKHPLNIAYEAATVDLKDINLIDSFHLETYGVSAVNYNRDIEMFPVIKRIIERISNKESVYQSPTDMGVNCVGSGIIDDQAIRDASTQEILRRYYKTACEYKKGYIAIDVLHRMEVVLSELNLKPTDRLVVVESNKYADLLNQDDIENKNTVVALKLADDTIITGRNSKLMSATSAAILNAIKHLANLSDDIHVMSPVHIEPILKLKRGVLGEHGYILNAEDILTTLSISAVTNPVAQVVLDNLVNLKNTDAHSTTILNRSDEQVLKKLDVNITCEPVYLSKSLYYNN